MSMIATGRPTSSRPCASRRMDPTLTVSTLRERLGARVLEGFSTARQTWVCHEILVRVEWFLPRAGNHPPARAGGKYRPALLVVEQIRQHDLVEHLLVHRRIEN